MVEAITAQKETEDRVLKQVFLEKQQFEFGLKIAQDVGYDLSRGRQDLSLHPYETSFGINDVRITTRIKKNDLSEALFSTLHEAGHAIYEQGISPTLAETPLSEGVSSGIHESQSRLWEKSGRSQLWFLGILLPKVAKSFS